MQGYVAISDGADSLAPVISRELAAVFECDPDGDEVKLNVVLETKYEGELAYKPQSARFLSPSD